MPSFLFWNLARKNVLHLLAEIATTHEPDIVVVAELPGTEAQVLLQLNQGAATYQYAPSGLGRLHIFVRFDNQLILPLHDSNLFTIRALVLPGLNEVVLVAAHLPSQLHYTAADTAFECVRMSSVIKEVERARGHQRTIVMGDFNLNPFDDGLISASGLHAVMDRRVALEGSRVVQGEAYPFFYNAMWSHFGDRTASVGGTFSTVKQNQ